MFSDQETESTRHYYSDDKIFEKSLDVYKPVVSNEKRAREIAAANLPTVLLVVGSGWVGHRAFVYAQTSAWNSSGPKTVASLGCTCVCIRHRGAFCVLPPARVIAEYLVLLFAILGAVTGGRWEIAIGITAIIAFILLLLALGGKGSASLNDMWNDVAEALQWIDNHRDLLQIKEARKLRVESDAIPSSSTLSFSGDTTATASSTGTSADSEALVDDSATSDNDSEVASTERTSLGRDNHMHETPFVFGGYSSGGHVAATLLQQPELFRMHNLPAPEDLFKGILTISGVMAVRPEQITIRDKTNSEQPIKIATPPNAPRWLTDLILRVVWGPEKAHEIPSPLTQGNPPNLPHLLVGCRNEMFGLPWLDVFFCSRAFSESVTALTGNYSKYVQVESDHWFILSSKALKDALQRELPLLVTDRKSKK